MSLEKNVHVLFVFDVPDYDLHNKDHDEKCRHPFACALKKNQTESHPSICFRVFYPQN